jgi:hypothetical protein
MNEFTALDSIQAPNTTVFGYRRGDPVGADVVENWGLEVGVHVCEGDLVEGDPSGPAMVRPGPEANRATWEQWAIANGMDPEQAAAAPMEDLEAAGPQEPAAAADPDRPADSARKAEWVTYVQGKAGDDEATQAWAAADSTTKADLQAWQPGSGDPIAEAATEATQG